MVMSTTGARTTGYQYGKKMNFYFYLILYSKINLIWNTDLKVKTRTINLAEEKGEELYDIEVGNNFLGDNNTELIIKNKYW